MAKPFLPTQSTSMLENQKTVSGNVLTVAQDADGDTLSVARIDGAYVKADGSNLGSSTFAGTYGTLTIKQDGTYTYTLTANIADGVTVLEDFHIMIRDGTGLFSSNYLKINVTGQNAKPFAVDDFANASIGFTGGNLLTNDTDADGDPLHVASIGVGSKFATEHISGELNTVLKGVYGTLVINDSGDFTYLVDKHDPDYIAAGGHGSEVFAYKVSDDKSHMDFGLLTVTF